MTQYLRTLAAKLVVDGIRVNVMSPGDVIEPDDDFDRVRTVRRASGRLPVQSMAPAMTPDR
jgi:NAD(P)-dependent dehydrogenase (short-subunit alcohol dehydrogenase family)